MDVLGRRASAAHAVVHAHLSSHQGLVRSFVACCLALALGGCGVDDRELEAAPTPTAGSANSGGSSTGGSSTGGTSSTPPPGLDAPEPPDCIYVGSEVADGCETSVLNPGFDKGISSWPPENIAVLVGWDNRDASESNDSGSLIVENTLYSEESKAPGEVMIGALQCVEATPGAVYDVSADLFIPEQETQGRAGVSAFFYKTPDCNAGMGGTDMSFTAELVKKQEEWSAVGGRFVVPSDAKSMQVRLIAAKPIAPRSFLVLFDNVLVQAK